MSHYGANKRNLLIFAAVCCLLLLTPARPAHAQSPLSIDVPDLFYNRKQSASDDFAPIEAEEDTVYPLTGSGAPPPKRKKPETPPPSAPPEGLKYEILSVGGAGRGVIGGDQHADGGVVVRVNDPNTGRVATLYADVVDYKAATGTLSALGGKNPPSQIRVVSEDGTLNGDTVTYDLTQRTGLVANATMTADTFRLHGTAIEALPDGTYVARNAMFTTCVHGSLDGHKGYPDYRVSAKTITVLPGKYVIARKVIFYLGKQRTIPLPSFKRDLETSAPVSSVPTPSYDRVHGLTMHFVGAPEAARHETFDYNTNAGFVTLPTGYVLYQKDVGENPLQTLPPKGILSSLGDPLNSLLQQFNPPTYRAYVEGRPYEIYPNRITFYTILGNGQYIFNRTNTGLSLSRFPELGLHIGNMLGHLSPLVPTPEQFERDRIPYAPALLEAYISGGELHENPTNVSAGRLFSRVNFASQPQLLGHRLSWRYAATNWLNMYTTGTLYELFAPELELDYVPTSTSSINFGYRYLTDAGATPFLTDHRDIRHETRLQYQVGGPVRFSVTLKYDISQLRPYDEELAIVRNLDCLQYGVAYRLLSREFNVIFSLLPVRKKQQ